METAQARPVGVLGAGRMRLPQAALSREVCRVLKPRRYQLDEYGR